MHFGGDLVGTKRLKWKTDGCAQNEGEEGRVGRCAHFRQLRLRHEISMPMGFPAAHFSIRSPKLRFVEHHVQCRKAGG